VARFKELAFLRKYAQLLTSRVADPNPHGSALFLEKPDPHQHQSEKQDPEPHKSQKPDPVSDSHRGKNSGAVEAQNGAMEGRGRLSNVGVEAQNGAVEDL
jgi:hypothetical protein